MVFIDNSVIIRNLIVIPSIICINNIVGQAVGITENTDAAVLVVSEETGIVSLATDGALKRPFTVDELRSFLNGLYRSKVNGLGSILRNFVRKGAVEKKS